MDDNAEPQEEQDFCGGDSPYDAVAGTVHRLRETVESKLQVDVFLAEVVDQFGGLPEFAKHVFALAKHGKSEATRAGMTKDLVRLIVMTRKDRLPQEDDEEREVDQMLEAMEKVDGPGSDDGAE